MATNDFFPTEDYSIPETSNYMKFREGDNNFRVLSSAVVGYEYWNVDGKPVRSKEAPDETPFDIKRNEKGEAKIDYFWAFVVYNYEAKKIQILEIKQKAIMQYIQGLVKNPKWGNPKGYDLCVNRKGAGLETKYITTATPHSPVDVNVEDKYKAMSIDLQALFSGNDPFQM
jgi:hypothetical protein